MNPKTLKKIHCAVRNIPLAALPEEFVRQRLLLHMIETLKFPKSLLTVEKELSQLPHLEFHNQKIPQRRADVLCFAKGIHPNHELFPLLLIECKAVPLTDAAMRQLVGYNHFVHAPFIGMVNENEMRVGWRNSTTHEYQFIPYLPSYDSLVQAVLLP